jgi:hypothetical protein
MRIAMRLLLPIQLLLLGVCILLVASTIELVIGG